jgi:hypothetical protein
VSALVLIQFRQEHSGAVNASGFWTCLDRKAQDYEHQCNVLVRSAIDGALL